MKKHNGMRPQDIVVMLKIASFGQDKWYMKTLAQDLGISQSEVSESINRNTIAGLIASDKRTLLKTSLLDFLFYGLPYVYPQKPGAIVRGLPTAHSAYPLKNEIESNEVYVWPWADGEVRGQCIEPLIKSVPYACQKDSKLYAMLALTDAIRIGKSREKLISQKELKKLI